MTDPTTYSGANVTKTHCSTSYYFISPLKLDSTGKHVLITGAAWEDGIGFATASAFARAGASLIILAGLNGISASITESLQQFATQGGRPKPIHVECEVDISDQETVQRLKYFAFGDS